MAADVDEVIERMIEEKMGLYEPRTTGRRTANEIRDLIQYELDKRPKTTHELKNALNTKHSTIKSHCKHLTKLGAVKKIEVEETDYWKLVEK